MVTEEEPVHVEGRSRVCVCVCVCVCVYLRERAAIEVGKVLKRTGLTRTGGLRVGGFEGIRGSVSPRTDGRTERHGEWGWWWQVGR